MTRKEKLQIQKILLVKHNQYLLKQIVKLSANKAAILIRIKSHNKKYPKNKNSNAIHIKRLVYLLGVNQRTIHLLVDKQFFSYYSFWCNIMLDAIEVEKFIKSVPD